MDLAEAKAEAKVLVAVHGFNNEVKVIENRAHVILCALFSL